jgi:hypothetical protein
LWTTKKNVNEYRLIHTCDRDESHRENVYHVFKSDLKCHRFNRNNQKGKYYIYDRLRVFEFINLWEND